MDLFCNGIANWCKKNSAISDEDYPIVIYGIRVILNTSIKLLGIFLTGVLLQQLPAVLLSTTVFCSMRYWTGGWHSESHMGCFCTMLIPCVGPSLLAEISGGWIPWVSGLMAIYSIYKVLRYAPCNSRVNPIEDVKILKLKRVGSIAEVIIVNAGVLLGFRTEMKWLIGLPLFIEAILIPKRAHVACYAIK